MIEYAYAKINLALKITGITDNMHTLDGIYVPVNLFDTVAAEKNDGGFSVTYDTGARYENDTVLRVAGLIKEFYCLKCGADFKIIKKIPEKRGLGGSSADAGAAARLLQKLYNLPEIDARILVKAGSDVPYMYKAGIKRVKGIGETVEEVSLPPFFTVTLYSSSEMQGVSTKDCFSLFDKMCGGKSSNIEDFLKDLSVFNDLSESAKILCPTVNEGLEILKSANFNNISVSGSGNAVFALETDKNAFNEKCLRLQKILPDNFEIIVTK